MQKTMFIRPERQPRSVKMQELRFILVPGKRVAFTKQYLPPVPPTIDRRKWFTVAQVRRAVAGNHLARHFVEQAFAEARAYELALAFYQSLESRFESSGAPKMPPKENGTQGTLEPSALRTFASGKVLPAQRYGKPTRTIKPRV